MSSKNDSLDSFCIEAKWMTLARRGYIRWGYILWIGYSLVFPQRSSAENRALLVGVTGYPRLNAIPEVPKLRGPDNDVNLMRHVLIQRGFSPDKIRVLSTAKAQPSPTRNAILAALDQMAGDARSGDQVVVYLSGHGSQQPAENTPDNWEQDGLDEVFLPTDVREWHNGDKRVKGAITDNEIGKSLGKITQIGAYVWFIADTCHSGTITRGNPGVARQVPANALIPESILEAARSTAISTHPTSANPGSPGSTSPGWVEMYACQPHESTPELPLGGESDKYYGLFTYHLAQALLNAEGAFSHADLMEQVRAAYRARGIESPSPVLQGADARRRVLGSESLAPMPTMSLHYIDGKPRVSGGRLAGLEPGSILQVHPWNAGSPASKIPAYVRVHTTSLLEAEVAPCKFNGHPAVSRSQLKEGSRCTVVSNRPPDLSLKIAIDPTLPTTLWTYLEADPRLQSRMTRVARVEDADWTIEPDQPSPDSLVLHSVWRGDVSNPTNQLTSGQSYRFPLRTPRDSQPNFAPLADALARVAHVTSFFRAIQTPEFHQDSYSTLAFSVGMRIHQGESDTVGYDSIPGPNGRLFRQGDITTVTVTNTGKVPLQLILFSVDSSFRITRIPLAIERPLRSGESLASEPMRAVPGSGFMEQIVVIGVPYESGRVMDFACLEQEPIVSGPAESARGKAVSSAAPSPRPQRLGATPDVATVSPLSHWLGLWRGNPRSQELASRLPEYRIKTLAYRVQ